MSCSSSFICLVSAYKTLGPLLSKQVFSKTFGNENTEFHKFLWFLVFFFWNFKQLDIYEFYRNGVTFDCNSSILTNQIRKWYYQLSEISFVGCNYLGGQMCIVLLYDWGPQYQQVKLTNQKFNYKPKMLVENGKICNKLLNLTVMNFDLLDWCYLNHPIPTFFDLDK